MPLCCADTRSVMLEMTQKVPHTKQSHISRSSGASIDIGSYPSGSSSGHRPASCKEEEASTIALKKRGTEGDAAGIVQMGCPAIGGLFADCLMPWSFGRLLFVRLLSTILRIFRSLRFGGAGRVRFAAPIVSSNSENISCSLKDDKLPLSARLID